MSPIEKLDHVALPAPGAIAVVDLDPRFFVAFPGHRAHQVRLQGGDCSTDSFCVSKPFH